jgi:hypothetical protein
MNICDADIASATRQSRINQLCNRSPSNAAITNIMGSSCHHFLPNYNKIIITNRSSYQLMIEPHVGALAHVPKY